jgi:osmotically inducible protein OsmC
MKIQRSASVVWQGGFPTGTGNISTQSGALRSYPYGVASRFEGQRGSNPEELIAAAHASCYAMAFALVLGEARYTPRQLFVSAEVPVEQQFGDFDITSVDLAVRAEIDGIDALSFEQLADQAKARCPVSKLLRARITLDVALASTAAG